MSMSTRKTPYWGIRITGAVLAFGLSAGAAGAATPRTGAVARPETVPSCTPWTESAPLSTPAWIVTGLALPGLIAEAPNLGTSYPGMLKGYLNVKDAYVTLNNGVSQIPSSWTNTSLTQSFDTETALVSAIDSGLAPHVKAVLLDDEAWSQSDGENDTIADVETAYVTAANAAHAAGLIFIATPGTDLGKNIDNISGDTDYQDFIAADVLPTIGQCSDVLDIQGQGIEEDANPSPPAASYDYIQYINAAKAQARTYNANLTLLGGISTNNNGSPATPATVDTDAIEPTFGVTNGFWLNDPSMYDGPYPALALEMVNAMDTGGHWPTS